MKVKNLFLTLAVLVTIVTTSGAAQVYPVRLDPQEPEDFGPSPALTLDDGGIKFPDGSIQTQAARRNPDTPCFDNDHRFVNCGNGTVTDTETGLIWLENLNCISTTETYAAANTYAAALWEGSCPGLSDGSRPGDWRLPTSEEWKLMVAPTCPNPPKIVGNGTPSEGCYSDSAWAIGLAGTDVFWASNTDFANATKAWGAGMPGGVVALLNKVDSTGYWPVRGDGRPDD